MFQSALLYLGLADLMPLLSAHLAQLCSCIPALYAASWALISVSGHESPMTSFSEIEDQLPPGNLVHTVIYVIHDCGCVYVLLFVCDISRTCAIFQTVM